MRNSKVKNLPLVCLVSSLLAFAGSNALAGNDREQFELSIDYADLNVYTEAGAKALYNRVKRAARDACGPVSARSVGRVSQHAQSCFEESMRNALAQVDTEVLALMGKGGIDERKLIADLVAERGRTEG